MFEAVLFTVVKTWKKSKRLSTDEWIKNNVVHVYNGTIWMEIFMLSDYHIIRIIIMVWNKHT